MSWCRGTDSNVMNFDGTLADYFGALIEPLQKLGSAVTFCGRNSNTEDKQLGFSICFNKQGKNYNIYAKTEIQSKTEIRKKRMNDIIYKYVMN